MVLTLYPEVQMDPIRDIWGNFSVALAPLSPAEPFNSVYCTDSATGVAGFSVGWDDWAGLTGT